jgi:diadenylate cyclase
VDWLINTWVFREIIRPVGDVLLLAYLLYKSYRILVQTRAVQLLKGTAVMVAIWAVALIFRLDTLTWILNLLVPGLVIGIAIVFQPELRKIFTRLGSREWLRVGSRQGAPHLETLLAALEQLSTRHMGALIVFPRAVGLRNIVQTGTPVDAELSTGLLLSIFHEGTPLHDGAIVVEGSRVAAAGCFLPLSEREDVQSVFGTRHRAALGLAEETDAVVVVVSEENGAVSLAHDGDVRYDLSLPQIESGLRSLLGFGAKREGPA